MKVKAEMAGVNTSKYKAFEKQSNNSIRVLAVTSGKGGVGKTHVSANLAYSLAKLGKRVLVFDADMGLANIDIILGSRPGTTYTTCSRARKPFRMCSSPGRATSASFQRPPASRNWLTSREARR